MLEDNPDLFYTLHEDGTIAAWEFNKDTKKFQSTFCDVVRGSKHGADRPGLLYAVALNPWKPTSLTAISADGKVWTWDFVSSLQSIKKQSSKWYLRGLLESTSSTISSMVVSPFGNEVAVGTSTGTLLIYDLVTCSMKIKHDMFNSPVRGIRWVSPNQCICFSSKQVGASSYINTLVSANIATGQHTFIRKDKEKDESYIRGIRVSESRKYLIVLPKERPVEVWLVEPSPKLIRILPIQNVTALEWCPLRNQPAESPNPDVKPLVKEHFFFTSADGSLHFYRVEGNHVYEDKKQPKIFANNQISALAWKDNLLVSGDTVGNLNLFEITNKKARNFATHRGLIRRIQFSPMDYHVIVLFAEGDFNIWDLGTGTKVAQSPANVKAECVDWIGANPIIATNTGSIVIYDLALQNSNSPTSMRAMVEPIQTPALLPTQHACFLRSLLEHDMLFNVAPAQEQRGVRNCFGEVISDDMKVKSLEEQILVHNAIVPSELRQKLQNPTATIPEKALAIAQFFSDRQATRFWRLAAKFLPEFKAKLTREKVAQMKVQEENASPAIFDTHAVAPKFAANSKELADDDSFERFDPTAKPTSNLPAMYDLLRDSNSVIFDELSLLKLHDESIRQSQAPNAADFYQQVAQSEALMGLKNQSVKLLLETPQNHNDLYLNYLHACVVAASNSKEHFNQTVQFVASSLVSLRDEKHITYGVEFLCLIGEGFKACKILQDFDRWERSAKLARCILPEDQCKIILTRWANHLQTIGKPMKSISVFMSLGLFSDVVTTLNKFQMYDIACLFLKACEEYGLPLQDSNNVVAQDLMKPLSVGNLGRSPDKSVEEFNKKSVEQEQSQAIVTAYDKYAQFLDVNCGNKLLAKIYRKKSADLREKYKLDAPIPDPQQPSADIPKSPEQVAASPPNDDWLSQSMNQPPAQQGGEKSEDLQFL